MADEKLLKRIALEVKETRPPIRSYVWTSPTCETLESDNALNARRRSTGDRCTVRIAIAVVRRVDYGAL